MNEKTLKNKIMNYIKNYGWVVKYYSGYGLGQAGVPDLICCLNGKFVAIEVKTEKGRLTQLQKFTIEQIKKKGGGIAEVVYGWQDFKDKFKKILLEVNNYGTEKNNKKNN